MSVGPNLLHSNAEVKMKYNFIWHWGEELKRVASPPPTLAKRNHFSTQTNQAESESAPKARPGPDSPRHAILKQQGSRANPQPAPAPLSCLPACLPTPLQWVKVRNGPRTKRSDLLSLWFRAAPFRLRNFCCDVSHTTLPWPPHSTVHHVNM